MEDELKHSAVQRVVQEALRQLDRDFDTLVRDIAELKEEIIRDNFLLNQRQVCAKKGSLHVGIYFNMMPNMSSLDIESTEGQEAAPTWVLRSHMQEDLIREREQWGRFLLDEILP
jgi:hypothetical protein